MIELILLDNDRLENAILPEELDVNILGKNVVIRGCEFKSGKMPKMNLK